MTEEQTRKVDIAVVGATGLVGGAVLEQLVQRNFPVSNLYPLASSNSEGLAVEFGQHKLTVHDLKDFDFSKVQLAIFCVPTTVAREFIPAATETGCVVIDHSSAFRDDPAVPLVMAQINPDEIADYPSKNIIACPDSSTAHILLTINPLLNDHEIERVTVHAMRAVTDIGRAGIDELSQQSIALFNLKEIKCSQFDRQIAFNVLPAVKSLAGTDKPQHAVIENEIHEILRRPDIKFWVTTVQVPVFFGHSYRLVAEFKGKINVRQITEILRRTEGIKLSSSTKPGNVPTVVTDAVKDERLHFDQPVIRGTNQSDLEMWLVADNIRCGVASNSVQIAEILVKGYL